jgi:hypothetical protein
VQPFRLWRGLLNQRHITALLASLIAMTIGPLKIDAWLNAVKRGQTFATNGPLLSLKLNGKEVGDTLRLPAANSEVKITAWLRSFVPIDHLELICDGKVARELKLNSDGQSADIEDIIFGFQSGWCLLRVRVTKPRIHCLICIPMRRLPQSTSLLPTIRPFRKRMPPTLRLGSIA